MAERSRSSERPEFVKRGRFVRWAWSLAALFALVLALRTFVGDVYHVTSASMEPTIFGAEDGGEWVFVRFDRSLPKRFEIAVLLRPGERDAAVKRVVGLPGESVQISRGDVLVRSRRLPRDEPRPPLVPLFDDRWLSVREHFFMGNANANPWTESNGVWTVDARAIEHGADAGLMFLRDEFDDGYLGPHHERIHGDGRANDAEVELEFRIDDAGGTVRLGLVEQGDRFEARIEPFGAGRAHLSITRRNRSDALAVLAESDIELPLGAWQRARFSNIDDALDLELEGRGRVQAAYKENVLHASDILEEGKSFGYRVSFGGEAGRFSFRSIRVARDLVYTPRGTFGTRSPLELGPDELFVLGDHSSQSRDGREWGPVKVSQLVGRATAIVWPPSRWRILRATLNPR